MSENSVDSYIGAQPEQAISFDEFFRNENGGNEGPYSLGNQFFNKLFGTVDNSKARYEAYLTNLKNKNEFIASQSARAWDKMLDDTKYQRMMKDFEKAGLNPYLLINNNGISASSAPSSTKASYDMHSMKKSDSGSNSSAKSGAAIAAAILAVIKIAAMVL